MSLLLRDDRGGGRIAQPFSSVSAFEQTMIVMRHIHPSTPCTDEWPAAPLQKRLLANLFTRQLLRLAAAIITAPEKGANALLFPLATRSFPTNNILK